MEEIMNRADGNTRLARGLLWTVLWLDGVMLFGMLCALASNVRSTAVLLLLIMAGLTAWVLWYATEQGFWFEWQQERTFKRVCAGLGGNFVGQGRAKFQTKVRLDPISSVRDGEWKRQTIYPKLRNVVGNSEQWQAEIKPFYGQNVDDYNKQADRFALAFHVPFVAFDIADNGLISIRAGQVPVPHMFEYPVEQALGPVVPAVPAATDVRAVLQAVPMARTIAEKPWYMPIEGNHVLVIGRTGSGKGSWVWSIVFGLAQARQAGLVRFWGIDPKRVELAYGAEWWDEYADTPEGMVELLEKAVDELLERNKAIQGKARKFTPSQETPLNVIIIDELAYLSVAIEKKLHERAQRAMRSILWLGRATGYSLVGCSQSPLKEVLGERDYYPTKVALAMEAPMVDLVLGAGAHEAGAYCEQIPLREAGAGCAYVKDELSNKAVLVRAAFCSDQAIRMMLANPQAFGVEDDESLREYGQGYTGANTTAQLDFNNHPLDAGQPAPHQLRWEDLPPEVQRMALQYAQQQYRVE
jgi:hypothetical protein